MIIADLIKLIFILMIFSVLIYFAFVYLAEIINPMGKTNGENFANTNANTNTNKCSSKLDAIDIDNMVVIKRTPEYSKLINKLIQEKKFIFDDDQLKILNNPQQIYNIDNLSASTNIDDLNIKNESNLFYNECSNYLDKNTDYPNNLEDFANSQDLTIYADREYNKIINEFSNEISNVIAPNCDNIGVLKNNIPFAKNYLKNYYKDIYGNQVQAELADYFAAYHTLINNDDNIGFPVQTKIGKSNFIIPDQYNYEKYLTNAYNIDWNRIINPITYS